MSLNALRKAPEDFLLNDVPCVPRWNDAETYVPIGRGSRLGQRRLHACQPAGLPVPRDVEPGTRLDLPESWYISDLRNRIWEPSCHGPWAAAWMQVGAPLDSMPSLTLDMSQTGCCILERYVSVRRNVEALW